MSVVVASPKVQEFCKKLFAGLEADYWGDIEPEVFENIGNGVSTEDDLVCNKLDEEQMVEGIASMVRILEGIL